MRNATPTTDASSGSSNTPDWEAIARYLSGESSADESRRVCAWIAARPEEARSLDALTAAMERFAYKTPANLDVEAALLRVHSQMHSRTSNPEVINLPPKNDSLASRRVRAARTPRSWQSAAIAAGVLLLISAGVVIKQRATARSVTPARTIAAPAGQRDSVTLSDGTQVTVGPGSSLTIAAGYDQGARSVTLLGDGYFAVKHDDAHPFNVHVAGATITDVGTAFAVHADEGEGVFVSVTEGTVQLAAQSAATVTLHAGDVATIDPQGRATAQRGGAAADDIAWMKGQMIFRDAPIVKVKADLHRWLGIELVVEDSALTNRHLTASFYKDSRKQVLDVITLALGATYETKGDTVIVRTAPPSHPLRR